MEDFNPKYPVLEDEPLKDYLNYHGKITGGTEVFTGQDCADSYKPAKVVPAATTTDHCTVVTAQSTGAMAAGTVLRKVGEGSRQSWQALQDATEEIGDPTEIVYRAGKATVEIRWKDPVDHGNATWLKTVILRKTNNYPNDINDGTVVVESYRRDQFYSTPYVDDLIEELNTNWYYRIFAVTTDGVVSSSPACRFSPEKFTWDAMSSYVQSGQARSIFRIGDTLVVENENTGANVNFKVVGFDWYTSAESGIRHTVALLPTSITGSRTKFATPAEYILLDNFLVTDSSTTFYTKTGSTYSPIKVRVGKTIVASDGIYIKASSAAATYGSNDWRYSDMRKTGGAAVSYVNDLVSRFPDFGSKIRKVRVPYAQKNGSIKYTEDQAFPPTYNELDSAGSLTAYTGKAFWLRDMEAGGGKVQGVTSAGALTTYNANSTAVFPLFVINIG